MKYTTPQIIAMMLDWKSWREDEGYLTNGRVKMFYGIRAYECVDFYPKVLWDCNALSYFLTRPFWWYLNRKVRS
jgi:hypothetical protein